MVLRLDPRLPVVWRSPTSLQLGVTRPPVVLQAVTTAEEHLLAALAGGIGRSGLGMIGRSAGATDDDIERFLTRVSPALIADAPTPRRRLLVTGTGRTADALARLLAGAGHTVRVARDAASAATSDPSDLAVVTGGFVLDPELHGLWLRRDTPHLAVVFDDRGVTIGPLVIPGRGACLYCLQLHRTDADPAWPAIASQLWGSRAAGETELLAAEAAVITTRLVQSHLRGAASSTTQIRLDAATGEQSQVAVAPHPECGCYEPWRQNGDTSAATPPAASR